MLRRGLARDWSEGLREREKDFALVRLRPTSGYALMIVGPSTGMRATSRRGKDDETGASGGLNRAQILVPATIAAFDYDGGLL